MNIYNGFCFNNSKKSKGCEANCKNKKLIVNILLVLVTLPRIFYDYTSKIYF